jgi:hypothetical protein
MTPTSQSVSQSERLRSLVEQIERADQIGLDVFGVWEHHRREFLDSAPSVILGAVAARTQRIRLTSAVTILCAADPVRVFQEFATVDLLSQGRAEMVVDRGLFIEAFPLFGLQLKDYDSLLTEKLDPAKVRDDEQRPLVRSISGFPEWIGSLPEALTGVFADMARRWWDSRIICPCRSAWTTLDGRNHRWRNAQVPATHRSLQGGWEASRSFTRSI